MTVHGIDVSKWQENIDFKKVKAAGVNFVIIRAGYGQYVNQKDPYFEQNYQRAKAAGLNVGVYWYSYATSVEAAKKEAEICKSVIAGKQFEYPIYFDLEEKDAFAKGKAVCSAMVEAFCGVLEKAGYFAGLYISRSPLQTYITPEVAKRYALWVAEYGSKLNYNGSVGIWQNSSTWRVNGVAGNVDHDYGYVDYPTIIKNGGFNNFKKPVKQNDTKQSDTKQSNIKQGDTKQDDISVTVSVTEKIGDVNGDGKVDVSDISALAAHVKGKKPLKDNK